MADLYVALAVAIIAILITFLLSRQFKKPLNVVVLIGLSDAGKTALFSKIVFNKPKKTVTSLKENEAKLQDFNLKLIDLPGAERLRDRFWDQYKSAARHVMFVVDSSTIENQIRDLSEYLYQLLSQTDLHRRQVKFTIACNKQDLENSLKTETVGELLEKELNAIRATKTGQLGKTSDEEEDDYLAHLKGEEISLKNLKVNLIATSINYPDQLIKAIQ